jgi:hypothetical protein
MSEISFDVHPLSYLFVLDQSRLKIFVWHRKEYYFWYYDNHCNNAALDGQTIFEIFNYRNQHKLHKYTKQLNSSFDDEDHPVLIDAEIIFPKVHNDMSRELIISINYMIKTYDRTVQKMTLDLSLKPHPISSDERLSKKVHPLYNEIMNTVVSLSENQRTDVIKNCDKICQTTKKHVSMDSQNKINDCENIINNCFSEIATLRKRLKYLEQNDYIVKKSIDEKNFDHLEEYQNVGDVYLL